MPQKSEPRPHVPMVRQTRYRLMLLRANGRSSLLSMTLSMNAAKKLAEEIVDRHLQRLEINWRYIIHCPDRPRLIYAQVWHGTHFQGTWVTPIRREDGYQFEFHDRPRGKRRAPANEQEEPTWKAGKLVECLLLPQKTRRGGWRAKISGTEHEGPVTNWQDIPSNLSADDRVELRLCGISKQTGAAQFAWPQ